MAVERVMAGESVSAVAKELGVHRTLIYHWYENPEHPFQRKSTAGETKESPELPQLSLLEELRETQRVLGEKMLEVDFFKGALQRVGARRQRSGNSGAQTSTTKSEK